MRSRLSLNNIQWGEFVLSDLFDVKIGKNIDGNKINKNSGNIPYVTRKETNNGIDGFLGAQDNTLLNNYIHTVITIGNETAKPFIQKYKFYTGTKLNILSPKEKISDYALQFIAVLIEQHKNNFSYSFSANSTRLKKQVILLPQKKYKPDWQFMEDYMKQVEYDILKREVSYFKRKLTATKPIKSLNEIKWSEFFITDIFSFIQRGKRLTKANQNEGKIPYISSSALNNGVDNFISNTVDIRQFNYCLSLANSGSVGKTFFHSYNFIGSDHITALKKEGLNKYQYLFLSVIIERIAEKYSFNREINNERLKKEKILLPTTKENTPDWEYMENYMKNIENEQIKNWLQGKKQYI